MAVKPVPDGYQTVTPYLAVQEAARAIEFYKQAFGATEFMRLADNNGKIAHAEIKIGDSIIMLADEYPDMGFHSPQTLNGSPVTLMVYVENVDEQFNRAIAAGATTVRPLEDQFYGDRTATLSDPFGHNWIIASHVEDVSLEEIKTRMSAYAS
ncbi:MAG: VOC family protein [Leptolyngbyaceae cyanobacterium SL_7_1]|nr:VOC family protein [Leptolyngbyaceae cyanobacterium SL_7_1]